jgi:hypothetical protein
MASVTLLRCSQPGGVFDQAGGGPYPSLLPWLPVVLHAVVINQLNSTFRTVAQWLTARENHRTRHAHESSLIAKRVLFEAFDCYISLFYLAFCQVTIGVCYSVVRGSLLPRLLPGAFSSSAL